MAKRSGMSKYSDFLKRLDQSAAAPLYVLCGEEGLLRSEAEALIARKVVGAAEADPLNYRVFHGPANRNELGILPPAAVLDEAEAYPMLGTDKLVVVRGADAWVNAHGEALARYLEQPSAFAVMVLHVNKLDRRKKFAKRAQEVGVTVDCRPLYETKWGQQQPSADSELGLWIAHRAREHSLRLRANQVVELIEWVGLSLSALNDTLERLALFVGTEVSAGHAAGAQSQSQAVSADALEQVAAQVRSDKVFRLTDAVARGKLADALELTGRMFSSGLLLEAKIERRAQTIALLIIATAANDIERRVHAKSALARGESEAEAIKAVGVPPFRARDYMETLGNVSLAALLRQLDLVCEADFAFKTSAQEPEPLIEELLVRLHLARRGQSEAVAVYPG